MKFWQLVSIFRDNIRDLRTAASTSGRQDILSWLDQYHDHVANQNRTILDAALPDELTRKLLEVCDLRFTIENGRLRLICSAEHSESAKIIRATEVFDRFGGAAIEETLEFGSFAVPEEG